MEINSYHQLSRVFTGLHLDIHDYYPYAFGTETNGFVGFEHPKKEVDIMNILCDCQPNTIEAIQAIMKEYPDVKWQPCDGKRVLAMLASQFTLAKLSHQNAGNILPQTNLRYFRPWGNPLYSRTAINKPRWLKWKVDFERANLILINAGLAPFTPEEMR